MDPEDDKNRRRHPRVDIPLLVQYRFGALEEFRTDYALNVSRSGLFIETREIRPPGTRVFVQLTTRDGQHFLQGEGRVVRSMGGGYAIELTGFDGEAQAVLEGLVRDALGSGLEPCPRVFIAGTVPQPWRRTAHDLDVDERSHAPDRGPPQGRPALRRPRSR